MATLVSKKVAREKCLYSFAHMARLETIGQFPKRIRLGNGPRCRVGYDLDELENWIAERSARRNKYDSSR